MAEKGSAVRHLTAKNFDQEALSSDKPVVVNFWAPWCIWCKKLAPVYEEMATKYGKDLTFTKVNVEEERSLGERYGISSLPTLKYFCSGREIGEQVGAPPKERLEAGFKDIIKTHPDCLATSSPMRGK